MPGCALSVSLFGLLFDRCSTQVEALSVSTLTPTDMPSPIVELTVCSRKVKALLDTGAMISCISTALCAEMSWLKNVKTNDIRQVSAFDGRATHTLGTLSLVINHTTFEFHVFTGLGNELIIGWDLIKDLGMTISPQGIRFDQRDDNGDDDNLPILELPPPNGEGIYILPL